MNKKLRLLTISTLATLMIMLSFATIVAAEPKTEVPFSSYADFELVDPGKVWIAGNTLHVKDSYWHGTSTGPLGSVPYHRWYEQIIINLETGEGAFKARARVDFPMPQTTIELVCVVGKITDFTTYEGQMVGHGTGVLEGVFAKGENWGTITVGDGYSLPSKAHLDSTGIQRMP